MAKNEVAGLWTNHMHPILCVQNHKRTSYNVPPRPAGEES